MRFLSQVKCLICKKKFRIGAHRLKRNHRSYCSRSCYVKSLKKAVVFDCQNCGKRTEHKASHYASVKHHFCSHECWGQSRTDGGTGGLMTNGYRRLVRKGKSYLEHRWIMEKILRRKLRKGETVHHKNCRRADNRETNLELRMAGNHPKGWSLRQMREYLKTVPKRLGGLK